MLIDMGFNTVEIADRARHKSTDITYRYAQAFSFIHRKIVLKLNEIMGKLGEFIEELAFCAIIEYRWALTSQINRAGAIPYGFYF